MGLCLSLAEHGRFAAGAARFTLKLLWFSGSLAL